MSLLAVRVLIVDDQEPFRGAARAVVRSMPGFEVVAEVGDGETAVEAASETRPDLVLMDVNLPGIDGMEATRRLRDVHLASVVVLLSTYQLADLGEDLLGCGADVYLAKADFDGPRLAEIWDASRGRPRPAPAGGE